MVAFYHYLTAEQVRRLRYSPGAINYVRERLKSLTDRTYLQRVYLPRMGRGGDTPAIYRLARKGIGYLSAAGVEVLARYRPSEGEHSYLFLAHTLAVNDVLIAADLLTRSHPAITLAGVLHEQVLKRRPVAVTTGTGEKLSVIPDAWLDFRLPDRRMCVVLELDRGTVDRTPFRRKVRGLVAFSKGPYQEAFGSRGLTIAVATTAGEKRRDDMLAWIESELTDLAEERRGELFLCRAIPPGAQDSDALFLRPTWHHPFRSEPTTLLLPQT
jgi:hypothetical protein